MKSPHSVSLLFRRCGFNLIELLVVIAMIGVLSGIFVGSLRRFSINFYISNAAQQFTQDLQAGQTEAVNNDAEIVVELDRSADRYRFWRSVMELDTTSGEMIRSEFHPFQVITGDTLSDGDPNAWRYLTTHNTDGRGGNRVSFGQFQGIGGGSVSGVPGSDLVCVQPRTGAMSFCNNRFEGSVVLIPDRAYYQSRFGAVPPENGEMPKSVTRRIEVSFNGDFKTSRWDDQNSQWIQ